jgi:hypothetical protein
MISDGVVPSTETAFNLLDPDGAKPVKVRLHWKALDKSRVGANSVWAVDDDDDGFQLDPDEFDQLFVEREQKEAAKPLINNLVDPKRSQNAGIALARLKPFSRRAGPLGIPPSGFGALAQTLIFGRFQPLLGPLVSKLQ